MNVSGESLTRRGKGNALFLLSAFLALLLVGSHARAFQTDLPVQTPGKIEGRVVTPDHHRVVGAEVILINRRNGVEQSSRSDAEGRFSFSELPPGNYSVRVELEGFEPLEQVGEVKTGETTSLKFNLALSRLTERITVTATRTEQKLGDVPAHVSVLTREEINRSAALTVDGLLKQVPSFSLFRRTSSLVSHPTTEGVSLRGIGASGVSRTLVLVDGVPHNDPFGNWVYWSKIPQSQIESIEFAEGGVSNLYGSSAMAGVIHINTRKPQRKSVVLKGQGGMRGTGDVDFFGSHAFGPFGLGVGGSLFRTGGYRLVREEERGPVDINAGSRHRTLNWRLDYSPGSKITWFHNGRVFDEDRDNGTLRQENSTRETYLGGGLHGRTSDASDWRLNFFSHLQTFKSSFSSVARDRASETLSLLQEVPSRGLGVNGQWLRRFAASHQVIVGADSRWIRADNREDVFTLAEFNLRDRHIVGKQRYAGFFVQDLFTPAPKLVLILGARVDTWKNFGASRTEILNTTQATTLSRFRDSSETTVSPRAGLLFRLTDRFSLRGAFYQGFRAPTLNELYRPFRVGNVQTNENENLGPERLTGGEVGFNHILSRNLFWRVTGFWNRVKDPISNVTLSVTQALITRRRQNLGRLRVRGIDTEIEYRINPRWSVLSRYLFDEATVKEFSARREIEGKFLPQVPKHRLSLRLDYVNPTRASASLQGRFESSRFDDDLNRLKLGSMWVTDLMVSQPLGEQWEVFIAAENLFNRKYAVQVTPVVLLGTPIMVSAGVRFHIFPR